MRPMKNIDHIRKRGETLEYTHTHNFIGLFPTEKWKDTITQSQEYTIHHQPHSFHETMFTPHHTQSLSLYT